LKTRAETLASTLEAGAEALAKFASGLTPAEWETRVPHDGRKVGVVVHHVASVYPLEVELAQKLAAGGALTDVTWDAVHQMNANHAKEHDGVAPTEAIALLRSNAAAAARAVRAITNDELDRVAPNSLYGGAPLTCQFMLEDHAVRHSFHHLARIRKALGR
jgi:cystathionine beta-lyase/cystathionine gamma-synthase